MSSLSEPLLADMTPQTCRAGTHADWAVDSEHDHACPWCRIAELEAKLHAIGMTRTWRLENGKKFLYVEDVAGILFDFAPEGVPGDPR
ncbi:hypothetical protein ABZX65_27150 [Streptomyces sp. NPDC003300]|uniref:hypothetical protein n=1 Tax=unclassified Streptomyces TaxID=2593676 RepID=UPI0033B8B506